MNLGSIVQVTVYNSLGSYDSTQGALITLLLVITVTVMISVA